MALWIGFAAALLTITSFLPQVIRAWRTRQTKDLSIVTLGLILAGAIAWTVYGVLVEDLPVIVTNIAVTVSLLLLVIAKMRFG